jgi:hypothetical protein
VTEKTVYVRALVVYEEHMRQSVETLRLLIRYDPDTGEMTWLSASPAMFKDGKRHSAATRCAIWNAKYPGKSALAYREPNRPYAYGDILGVKYYAHRVAFALMTGRWPRIVDHIDDDKTNNVWSNLRDGSVSDNARNASLRANNKSGQSGVWFDAARQKWVAEIVTAAKKKKFLGRYANIEDAILARRDAQRQHGYSERHGSSR